MQAGMSLQSFMSVHFSEASYTQWAGLGKPSCLTEAARFLGGCFNLGSFPRDAAIRIQVKTFV